METSPTALDRLVEGGHLTDSLIRFGIRRFLRQRLGEEGAGGTEVQCARLEALLQELRQSPIAIETRAANEQHYEVPTQFYQLQENSYIKNDGVVILHGAFAGVSYNF